MFIQIGIRTYNQLVLRSTEFYISDEYLDELTNFFGIDTRPMSASTQVAIVTKNYKHINCLYTYHTIVDESGDFVSSVKTYAPLLENNQTQTQTQ
jgi:hypothetical protein